MKFKQRGTVAACSVIGAGIGALVFGMDEPRFRLGAIVIVFLMIVPRAVVTIVRNRKIEQSDSAGAYFLVLMGSSMTVGILSMALWPEYNPYVQIPALLIMVLSLCFMGLREIVKNRDEGAEEKLERELASLRTGFSVMSGLAGVAVIIGILNVVVLNRGFSEENLFGGVLVFLGIIYVVMKYYEMKLRRMHREKALVG